MRIIVVIAIFLLYGGANYYVASRMYRMLNLIGGGVNLPVFAIVFSLISVTVLLSFFRGGSSFQRIVSAAGSVWMGILMYLLLFTAAADIILLVLRLTGISSDTVKKAAELAVLFLTALTVVCGAVHAGNINTARYSVDTGKASEPVKIVLLSDIHIGALGTENRLQKMADAISAEDPDIVCIAGDIFNNDFSTVRNPDAVAKAVGSIKSKYGVYACLGNHDCGNGFDEMVKLISDSGIKLLREEYCVIPGCCTVFGRADSSPISGTDAVKRGSFACPAEAGDLPMIVLDHNPANIGEYGSDVSLVLCGHTHRGQLFPGSLITNSMYTVDYGLLEASENSPAVIVTSGIGYWGPPLRVGTDSEIAVIELR